MNRIINHQKKKKKSFNHILQRHIITTKAESICCFSFAQGESSCIRTTTSIELILSERNHVFISVQEMCWWETSHRSNIQYAWKWACYRGSLSQRSYTSISHPHRCFQLLCLIRPLLRLCGCVQTQLEMCCTVTYWLMVHGLLWLNVIPGVTPPTFNLTRDVIIIQMCTKTTRVCVCAEPLKE